MFQVRPLLNHNLSYSHLYNLHLSTLTFLNLPQQTHNQKLTFLFCTCSFSEALEGLRLNIFFFLSGPLDISGQKAASERYTGFNQWGFLSLCCHCQSCQVKKNTEGGRAALRCSQTKCRSWEEVTWPRKKTEEANPVLGARDLHTGLWVCYMYLSASSSLWL